MGWLVWGFSIGVGEIFCTSPDCDPPSLLCNRYRVSFWVVKQRVLNLHGLHPPHLSLHTSSYPQPPPPPPHLHPPHHSVHTTYTHSLLLLFFILPITLYTLLHTYSLLLLPFSLFLTPHLRVHTLFTHSFHESSILPFLFIDTICRQCV